MAGYPSWLRERLRACDLLLAQSLADLCMTSATYATIVRPLHRLEGRSLTDVPGGLERHAGRACHDLTGSQV